jgi:hypothetical protein
MVSVGAVAPAPGAEARNLYTFRRQYRMLCIRKKGRGLVLSRAAAARLESSGFRKPFNKLAFRDVSSYCAVSVLYF